MRLTARHRLVAAGIATAAVAVFCLTGFWPALTAAGLAAPLTVAEGA